jgi:Phosphotransferase enzyme family
MGPVRDDWSSLSTLSRRALRAAVQTARDCGVRFREPVVLHDGSNLLVHLSPAPVVARVATRTRTVRPGDAWLRREVAVASHLAQIGAPVVSPSREVPPGPHRHDDLVLTFWEYAAEVDAPVDAAEAGRGLRVCHEALSDFAGELPSRDLLDEAEHAIDHLASTGDLSAADIDVLRRVGTAVRARVEAFSLPRQPLHGDAALGNVVNTAAGPLWNDWEDTFRGPIAWDLGCLHASAPPFGRQEPQRITAAQRGYGGESDPRVLETFIDARRFQVAVWSLVLGLATEEGGQDRVHTRLAWLRARASHAADTH